MGSPRLVARGVVISETKPISAACPTHDHSHHPENGRSAPAAPRPARHPFRHPRAAPVGGRFAGHHGGCQRRWSGRAADRGGPAGGALRQRRAQPALPRRAGGAANRAGESGHHTPG